MLPVRASSPRVCCAGSPHGSFSDDLPSFHPSIYEVQQSLAPCNHDCAVDSRKLVPSLPEDGRVKEKLLMRS